MPIFDKTLSGDSRYYATLAAVPGTQSIENNATQVEVILMVTKTAGLGYWGNNPYYATFNVYANGSRLTLENATYDFRGSTPKTIQFFRTTITVPHDDDGRKTLSVSASWSDNGHNPIGNAQISESFELNTIPRASAITSFPNFEIGNELTWLIDRKVASFKHKLQVKVGSTLLRELNDVTTTSGSLTLTEAENDLIYQSIPNTDEATIQLICTTFNGASQIGSAVSKNAKAKVPSTIVPTLSAVTVSEANATVSSKVGKYVQNLSRLNLAIVGAAGSKYSTIVSYKIEAAGQTANAQSGVTNTITVSGNIVVKGTVTDSRGRVASRSITIQVLQYTIPSLTEFSLMRSKSSGDRDPFGSYIKLMYKAAAKSLMNGTTEKNTLSVKVESRQKGGSWVTKATYTEPLTPTRSVVYAGYSATLEFDVRLTLTDVFGATTQQVYSGGDFYIPVGGANLFVGFGGLASAFGKIPTHGSTYNVEFGPKGFHSEGPGYVNDRRVLDENDLTPDSGWVDLPLRSGIPGTLRVRRIGSIVEMHLHLTNPVTSANIQSGAGRLTKDLIPVAYRPSGLLRMVGFIDAPQGLSQEIAIDSTGDMRVYVTSGWTTKAQLIGSIVYTV